jgi:hypothetical protein
MFRWIASALVGAAAVGLPSMPAMAQTASAGIVSPAFLDASPFSPGDFYFPLRPAVDEDGFRATGSADRESAQHRNEHSLLLRTVRDPDVRFLSTTAAAVVGNAMFGYLPGSPTGGDRWIAGDKLRHLGGSYALTLSGVLTGARPWVAATGTCAGGAAFELTQVRFSSKDVVVNCVGAAAGWAVVEAVRAVR